MRGVSACAVICSGSGSAVGLGLGVSELCPERRHGHPIQQGVHAWSHGQGPYGAAGTPCAASPYRNKGGHLMGAAVCGVHPQLVALAAMAAGPISPVSGHGFALREPDPDPA
jgi:hypothetical protein